MSSIDFTTLKMPIPQIVFSLTIDKQEEIYNYLSQMNDIQKKAYVIANEHLGTSFSIYKSNGYKDWKKQN
jgi:hypothetical protein